MNTMICSLCGIEKDELEFRMNGKYRRKMCHDCELKQKSKRDKTEEGRMKSAEWSKKWRRTPLGSAYCREYFKTLRESEDFKDKMRKDPRRKESYRRWMSNPENKSNRAEWYRNKRKIDPRYRVSNGFSRSVRRGLKSGKGGVSWTVMVGYSVGQLMEHLEAQFSQGMTWENYGNEWHIDHILPVSSFSFSSCSDNDFKKCWSLSNLRPMWAIDNLKKGSKIVSVFDKIRGDVDK